MQHCRIRTVSLYKYIGSIAIKRFTFFCKELDCSNFSADQIDYIKWDVVHVFWTPLLCTLFHGTTAALEIRRGVQIYLSNLSQTLLQHITNLSSPPTPLPFVAIPLLFQNSQLFTFYPTLFYCPFNAILCVLI